MLKRVREFLVTRKHNAQGEETPDSRPMEIPVGCRRPESLSEMVRRLVVAEEFKRSIMASGAETLDESNDFDIDGDDPEDQFSEAERMAVSIAENDDVREARSDIGRRSIAEASERLRGGNRGSAGNNRVHRSDDEGGDPDSDERGFRRGAEDFDSRERRGSNRQAVRNSRRSRDDGEDER